MYVCIYVSMYLCMFVDMISNTNINNTYEFTSNKTKEELIEHHKEFLKQKWYYIK